MNIKENYVNQIPILSINWNKTKKSRQVIAGENNTFQFHASWCMNFILFEEKVGWMKSSPNVPQSPPTTPLSVYTTASDSLSVCPLLSIPSVPVCPLWLPQMFLCLSIIITSNCPSVCPILSPPTVPSSLTVPLSVHFYHLWLPMSVYYYYPQLSLYLSVTIMSDCPSVCPLPPPQIVPQSITITSDCPFVCLLLYLLLQCWRDFNQIFYVLRRCLGHATTQQVSLKTLGFQQKDKSQYWFLFVPLYSIILEWFQPNLLYAFFMCMGLATPQWFLSPILGAQNRGQKVKSWRWLFCSLFYFLMACLNDHVKQDILFWCTSE